MKDKEPSRFFFAQENPVRSNIENMLILSLFIIG
jgi:hypothetical protein